MDFFAVCSLQGWLQRLGIQIEGGQGFLLDKLISITGKLGLPVCVTLQLVFSRAGIN